MRRVLVLLLVLFGATAYADTIAMLPLDGEKRLEIYGQPVAAEIARALKAAGLDVIVVGAKMDVPDRANLIVDGTIKSTKKKQIELSIRIRDPRDGSTLDTLPAPTTKLDDLDKAAADLSAKVVPAVKTQLDVLAKKAAAATVVPDKPIDKPALPPKPRAPAAPTLVTCVVGVAICEAKPTAPQKPPAAKLMPLVTALDREAILWAAAQRYEAKIAFEVVGYKATLPTGKVPSAHARVRVKVLGTPFDRIVRTDTVVGDLKSTPDELAARTAREVLAIVRPNLKRALAR